MLDAVQPGVEGIDHRLLRPAVGGRQSAETVGRLDGSPELVRAVRRVVGDVPGRRATGGHDLDVVRALRDQLPDGGPDRLEAVGHPVAPVEVAVSMGHGAAAQEKAWPDEVAPLDRLADDEGHAVPAAVVAERRHATGQVALKVPDRDQGHHLVRVEDHLLVRAPIAGQREVGVGVDQARQQRRVREALHGGRRDGFRTFSRKTVLPSDAEGRWSVDVITDSGQLIGRLRFRVES